MLELFIARKLGVEVELRPFISEKELKWGYVENDTSFSDIKTGTDCEVAECWDEDDKKSIHKAIKNSPEGFVGVNLAVERIRLEYLLDYPIDEIIGGSEEG